MEYLDGEFPIDTLGSIQLTNYRLFNWTDYQYQSIRLEQITYIGLSRRQHPFILKAGAVISLVLVGYGYLVNREEGAKSALVLSLIVMGLALLIYYLWLESSLSFQSSGGAIYSDMKNSDYFVNQVEAAIAERVLYLSK